MRLFSVFNSKQPLRVKILRDVGLFFGLILGLQYSVDLLPDGQYTPEQKQMLNDVFKEALDIDSIRYKKSKVSDYIVEKHQSDAFAIGNTVHMHSRFNDEGNPVGSWVFLHEHVHIWQNQNCNVEIPSFLNIVYKGITKQEAKKRLPYFYTLDANKDLSDYNVEQQANMIADYWRIKDGEHPVYLDLNQNYKKSVELYQSVLARFLEDPSYIQNHCQNIVLKPQI